MRKKTKLVYGVGVNDAYYSVYKYENGKIVWQCPLLQNMEAHAREHSDNSKRKRPTYQDVTVCESGTPSCAFVHGWWSRTGRVSS